MKYRTDCLGKKKKKQNTTYANISFRDVKPRKVYLAIKSLWWTPLNHMASSYSNVYSSILCKVNLLDSEKEPEAKPQTFIFRDVFLSMSTFINTLNILCKVKQGFWQLLFNGEFSLVQLVYYVTIPVVNQKCYRLIFPLCNTFAVEYEVEYSVNNQSQK